MNATGTGESSARRFPAAPVQPQENFADKWSDYPERAEHFFAWLRHLEADLGAAGEEKGLNKVATRLSESFGRGPIERAAERLGDDVLETRKRGELGFDKSTGALTVVGAGATAVKPHDFYGTTR